MTTNNNVAPVPQAIFVSPSCLVSGLTAKCHSGKPQIIDIIMPMKNTSYITLPAINPLLAVAVQRTECSLAPPTAMISFRAFTRFW